MAWKGESWGGLRKQGGQPRGGKWVCQALADILTGKLWPWLCSGPARLCELPEGRRSHQWHSRRVQIDWLQKEPEPWWGWFYRLHKAGRAAGNPFISGPTGRRVIKPQMSIQGPMVSTSPLTARCSSGGPLLTSSQAEEGKMSVLLTRLEIKCAYHIVAVLPLHFRQVNTTVVGFPSAFPSSYWQKRGEKESIWQMKTFPWDHRPGQPSSSEFLVHAWGLWMEGTRERGNRGALLGFQDQESWTESLATCDFQVLAQW